MAGRRTEVDASSQDGTSLEETKATTYTQEMSQPKGEQANSETADPAADEEEKEEEDRETEAEENDIRDRIDNSLNPAV